MNECQSELTRAIQERARDLHTAQNRAIVASEIVAQVNRAWPHDTTLEEVQTWLDHFDIFALDDIYSLTDEFIKDKTYIHQTD